MSLKLKIDELRVDTFHVTPAATREPGTVHGHAADAVSGSCQIHTCGNPTCQVTCYDTCLRTCVSCFGTCEESCNGSCMVSCQGTCASGGMVCCADVEM